MRLSILVVSRTAGLLSSMLRTLKDALHLPGEEVEVLCSWNGTSEEEALIENASGYEFLVANRAPYHFASNMNTLADKAIGEVLLLINDDVLLDANSLDGALNCLTDKPKTGLVGARLRDNVEASPMPASCSTGAIPHITSSIGWSVLRTMRCLGIPGQFQQSPALPW